MTTQETVRRIALALPQTSESDQDFSFHVGGRRFVSLWRERVEPKKPKVPNPGVIVVLVADPGEKEALLRSDPATFFTTDHYDGHNAVLVRLAKVDAQELTELITDSWCLLAPDDVVEEFERG